MPNTPTPSETLTLIKGSPNPNGARNVQLYLCQGDPAKAPIRQIVPAQGLTLPAPREDLAEHPFRLKILHINDLHGHISRFTPYGDRPVFSKIVWRLRQVRQKRYYTTDTAILAMSAGDDLIGSVFDELLGDEANDNSIHAGYQLYSAAGMDAGTLGNHDLDIGAEKLAHAIEHQARFPILCANLTGCQRLAGLVYPAAVLVVKGIRVGVIGLITPAGIKSHLNSGLHIANPIQVVHNILPALRPLCDVVIILSHLGYSLGHNSASASVREAGDVELARSLPPHSVHLIIGGHTHNVLNGQGLSARNIVNGIPIVQAGALGNFVGEVDITLNPKAAVTNARLTSTADLPVDQDFEVKEVQPLAKMARPLFDRSLGKVDNNPDFDTDTVRNCFSTGESALANFITDALVSRCRVQGYDADLAVLDAPNVRCGLPAGGELTFGDWFNLMPFADTIRLLWITGRQLKDLLQDNACRIDRPGDPHTERGFLHFSRQLRYKIKLGNSRPQARARDITVDGIPLDEQLERSFLIACSSFVRQASLPWEKLVLSQAEVYVAQFTKLPLLDIHIWPRLDTNLFLRDELIAYIRAHGGVTQESGAQRDGRLQVNRPEGFSKPAFRERNFAKLRNFK